MKICKRLGLFIVTICCLCFVTINAKAEECPAVPTGIAIFVDEQGNELFRANVTDTVVDLPEIPVGYEFDGWYYNNTKISDKLVGNKEELRNQVTINIPKIATGFIETQNGMQCPTGYETITIVGKIKENSRCVDRDTTKRATFVDQANQKYFSTDINVTEVEVIDSLHYGKNEVFEGWYYNGKKISGAYKNGKVAITLPTNAVDYYSITDDENYIICEDHNVTASIKEKRISIEGCPAPDEKTAIFVDEQGNELFRTNVTDTVVDLPEIPVGYEFDGWYYNNTKISDKLVGNKEELRNQVTINIPKIATGFIETQNGMQCPTGYETITIVGKIKENSRCVDRDTTKRATFVDQANQKYFSTDINVTEVEVIDSLHYGKNEVFEGWYYNGKKISGAYKNGKVAITLPTNAVDYYSITDDENYIICEDHNVTASIKEKRINIEGCPAPEEKTAIFVDEQGNELFRAKVTDTQVDLPEIPVGYEFDGWYYKNTKISDKLVGNKEELRNQVAINIPKIATGFVETQDGMQCPTGYETITIVGKIKENSSCVDHYTEKRATFVDRANQKYFSTDINITEVEVIDSLHYGKNEVFEGWYYNGQKISGAYSNGKVAITLPQNAVDYYKITDDENYTICEEHNAIASIKEKRINIEGCPAPEEKTAIFVDEQGNELFRAKVTDTQVDLPEIPVGYSFEGWYYNNTKVSGNLLSNKVEINIPKIATGFVKIPNGMQCPTGYETITIVGKITKNESCKESEKVVVSFIDEQGKEFFTANITDTIVPVPEIAEGYEFEGWYYNGKKISGEAINGKVAIIMPTEINRYYQIGDDICQDHNAKIEIVAKLYKVLKSNEVKILFDEKSEIINKLTVNKIENDSNITEKLKKVSQKYIAYNFELYDENNNKIEPNGKVKVYVPIPSDYDKSDITVFYISDDNIEKVESKIVDDYIEFEVSHFSQYALVENAKVFNPETSDNIGLYIIFAMALISGIIITLKKLKLLNK